MPLTEEQIREYYRRGLAAGIPREDLIATVRSRMGAPEMAAAPSSDPIADLQSQFEGTLAIPGESVSRAEDQGAIMGLNDFIPAALKEVVGGPFAGIGETFGLVEEGTRNEMRQEFQDAQVKYLQGNPGVGRAAVAGILEGGANLIPLAPSKYIGGKVGGKLLDRFGRRGAAIGGAAAGAAAEGAVVAVGETAGLPLEERLKKGALMMAAATGLGTLGGMKAIGGPDTGAKDPVVRNYLDTYKAGDSVKEKTNWFSKMKQQWSNNLDILETAGRRASEKTGDPEFATIAEIRAQQARTAEHTSLEPIMGKTRTIDGKETGEGLDDIFRDMDPDAYHEVEAYSMARHNLELSERKARAKDEVIYYRDLIGEAKRSGDKTLERQAKEAWKKARKTAGMKLDFKGLQDSEGLVRHLTDKYGVDPKTGEAAVIAERSRRLTEFSNRAIIEPLVEVGVFSRATADEIMASGEWYVPFLRAVEELDRMERLGFVEPGLGTAPVRGKFLTRGLESKKGLRIKDIYQALGERSIMIHSFARKQALRNLLADMGDRFGDDIGLEVQKMERGSPGNTFRVFRDGELFNYGASKDLLDAVESLNFREANWVLRSARAMTRVFRAGATLTPQFGFGNVARDQFTFGVYSKEGGIPFFGPARAMIDEGLQMLRNEGLHSKEWDAFMRSSGGHASFVDADRFNTARHVEILRRKGARGSVGRFRKLARETKANPLAPLQALSSGLERPGRFAEFRKRYRRAIKEGATPERAEQLAGIAGADVTLNFPRGGTIGKRWNLYEAFHNAMLQDVSKFSRAMTERPFKTLTKAMAYITAPSLLAWAKHKDDPDYQSLPEWDKALFIHLHKFENGRFFRIPMPPGILGLMFSYIPRRAAEAFLSDSPDALGQFFGDVAGEATEQTPLQYLPIPGINPAKDIFVEGMPNAVQPVMELVANRSPFFDRPVISKKYEGLPPAEQKHWRTTNVAKLIAGVGNALGGQVSPIEVDHLIAGYGGGGARQLAGLTGSDAPMGQRMAEEGIFRFPGLDRFVSSSPYGFGSQPVQDFYELLDVAEKHEQGLKRQSTNRHYDSYLRLHPEAAYGKELRRVGKTMHEYAEWRDQIRGDKDLTDWEKEDQLLKVDQETTRYAAEVMKSMHDAIRMDQLLLEER